MKLTSILLFLLMTVTSYSQSNYERKAISVNDWIDGDLYIAQNHSEKLVIIVAGSGPTDRNGNQPQIPNNSLKFLAEGLVQNGINVYTFDKKIIKQMLQPDFDESKLLFEDMVNDVQEIVEFFKKEKKYKNIYLIGHSEGSLVSILAAQKSNVSGLISIAGTAQSIDRILSQQIAQQAPFLSEETNQILEQLKSGKLMEKIHPMLEPIFRKSVQPYLISWMKYSPIEEIQKLNCPILILHGNKDLQVTIEEAKELHKVYPKSKIEIFDNMNHILKDISGDTNENMASYSNPDLPVNAELIVSITNFIEQ